MADPDDIELKQQGYVAELVEVFNRAKANNIVIRPGLFASGGGAVLGGGAEISSISVLDEASSSSPPTSTTADPQNNSRTSDSPSKEGTLSPDLSAIMLSDYYMGQSSSSCQWSSPEGCPSEPADQRSLEAFATFRPRTKCACICNEKNCKFLEKPYEGDCDRSSPSDNLTGHRNSHLRKVFTMLREKKSFHQSYEVPKEDLTSSTMPRWWKRRRTLENHLFFDQRPNTPTLPSLDHTASMDVDDLDCARLDSPATISNMSANIFTRKNGSIPEVIEMEGVNNRLNIERHSNKDRNHERTNGIVSTNLQDANGLEHHLDDSYRDDDRATLSQASTSVHNVFLQEWLRYCKLCKYWASPIRIVLLVLGTLLFLAGISYDFGVKHGVDSVIRKTWHQLMAEYIDFGNKFVSYNELFLSSQKFSLDRNYVILDNEAVFLTRKRDFWSMVAEKDPKFIYIMENLEFSLQVHFMSLVDSAKVEEVKVKDRGPLFLKVTFTQSEGFRTDYIRERSNITLSTPFHVYDLMKVLFESNDLPHFGLHMKDYYDTTPTALLEVVVNALKKFKISTSFLETLQVQSRSNLRKRRSKVDLIETHNEWDVYKNIVQSTFLSLPLYNDGIVTVPIPLIEKNLTFEYFDDVRINGLLSHRYSFTGLVDTDIKLKYYPAMIEKWKARTQNLNNLAIALSKSQKAESDSIRKKHPMALDLGPAIIKLMGSNKFLGVEMKNYPFWASSPHFVPHYSKMANLAVDPDEAQQHPISGFFPSMEEHGSFLYYHPVLGVPMNTSLAVQFGIRPPDKMLHGGRIVPVLWLRIQLERIPSSLWYTFCLATHVRSIVITSLCCSGLLLISAAVICRCSLDANLRRITQRHSDPAPVPV